MTIRIPGHEGSVSMTPKGSRPGDPPTPAPAEMEGIRKFIAAGLRFKVVRSGEYTSMIVQDAEGKVIFRGALILRFWPKLRTAFENMPAME